MNKIIRSLFSLFIMAAMLLQAVTLPVITVFGASNAVNIFKNFENTTKSGFMPTGEIASDPFNAENHVLKFTKTDSTPYIGITAKDVVVIGFDVYAPVWNTTQGIDIYLRVKTKTKNASGSNNWQNLTTINNGNVREEVA